MFTLHYQYIRIFWYLISEILIKQCYTISVICTMITIKEVTNHFRYYCFNFKDTSALRTF